MGTTFTGSGEDKAKVRKSYERKIGFSKKSNSPIWNGEFGPVYATEISEGPKWKEINDTRYAALSEQLKVYTEDEIAWSIWLYKDIGIQGMIFAKPDSAWNTVFGDKIRRKRKHALEFWGTDEWVDPGFLRSFAYSCSTETTRHFQPVLDWITNTFPEAVPEYPP
jgi:hypothetical protein